jgi:predicted TIM-barrel fold metal-dependent hydrolase
MHKRFYNCHAHCFTYDHVPQYFLSKYIMISWLLKQGFLKKLIKKAPLTGQLGWKINLLLFILRPLFKKTMVIRYLNFVRYGDRTSQEEVIKSMQAYYPKNTGLVMLTMDMEYMGAGIPRTRFQKQLTELEGIKINPLWNDKIFPFIFCDPRRIEPLEERERSIEQNFICNTFINQVKEYIEARTYQGIKIYPALGYHAFDIRLKSIYDFAIANDIPVLTHCTIGAVHFKYDLTETERFHPFLNKILPDLKPFEFQRFFTHPLNFECLLNKDILEKHWGKNTSDFYELKICLAHWGNGDDWHNYLDNAWADFKFRKTDSPWPSLELSNWFIEDADQYKNFSWFTIICDLIRKYPNVYADISYTLNDASLLPLLKMTLETDEKIKQRVLFGTDFYLVSKASSERAFAINVRALLGNELFEQIAITNAERFLSNKFSQLS